MAKLSKLDAAKAVGVSRQTLYTYLKDGRLSTDADGLIDTAELLRAGFTLHTLGRQAVDTTGHDLTSNLDTTGHRLTSNLGTLDVYL
jgi:DNA-binding XRE family transcriptional regulator